jgi:spermidine synthase
VTRQLPIHVIGEENQLLALYRHEGERLAVWQNSRYRWLECNGVLQSAIERRNPERPLLPHQHELLCAAQAGGQPISRVLELGLGAGSNLRYLHHHQPIAHYQIIERNPEVIRLFHDHFAIAGRFQILKGDAALELPRQASDYDLLIVDIGTCLGLPPLLQREGFWQQAMARLRLGGRLVVNLLPANDGELQQLLGRFNDETGLKPTLMPLREYANVILSASRNLTGAR